MRARNRTVGVVVGAIPMDLPMKSDSEILVAAAKQTSAILAQTSAGSDVSAAWAKMEGEAAKTAAALAGVGVTVGVVAAVGGSYIATGMIALLGKVGWDALSLLLSQVMADILEVLTFGVISSVGTGAAAGAEFGYVGSAIGAIIGAVIGGVEVITGGPTVQVTNGATVKCKDYVSTNLPNAGKWLSSQSTLAGITPLWLANATNIFLANPVWLTQNQQLLGLHYPPVPDVGTGSPVDLVYQLPGAFELLNMAQFIEACHIVMLSPSKLPFYRSISWSVKHGGATPPPVVPDPNPDHYWPLVFQQAVDGQVCHVNCPTVPLDVSPGRKFGYDVQPHVPPINASLYSACPNLLTNSNVTIKGVVQQTDISPGAYALQVLYPALTQDQCERLFAAVEDDYSTNYNHAQRWAWSQITIPDPKELGSGSQWNLVADDVASILNSFAANQDPAAKAEAAAEAASTAAGLAAWNALAAAAKEKAANDAAAAAWANATHATGVSFGPTQAALNAAANALAASPWGAGFGSPFLGPGLAAGIAELKPPYTPPPPPPPGHPSPPPPTAILPLPTAHQIVAGSGAGNPGAGAVVGAVSAGANAGDPTSIANALTMDLAQRLQAQASVVEEYVGPQEAPVILAGNFAALPRGTGKYDPNLPLVLELAVDRMLADPHRTARGLQGFAAALVQMPGHPAIASIYRLPSAMRHAS